MDCRKWIFIVVLSALALFSQANPGPKSSVIHYVVVDKQAQKLYEYKGPFPFFFDRYGKGGRLLKNRFDMKYVVRTFHVSTGRVSAWTPTGVARLTRNPGDKPGYAKGHHGARLRYQLHLEWMDDVSIHAWPRVPKYPASSGCIRLQPGDAKALYADLVPKGAVAFVVNSVKDQPRPPRKHRHQR